jgi:hypothetical protein
MVSTISYGIYGFSFLQLILILIIHSLIANVYYIFMITLLARVFTFGPLDFIFGDIGEVAATRFDERFGN